jgi:polar amino acid transport system substrate-binding protein
MKHPESVKPLAAAWLALALWPAVADEVPLYLMVVPPYTINEAARKGAGGDIALEAMRRAGYQARLEVVPNNRAIATVQSDVSRDTLIVPLARLKEREAGFTWVAPVARVNRAFFAPGRAVQSFGEARAAFRVIAVARGTAGVAILREQGFADSQLYEVADNITAARMLMLHRVDAWYGPVLQFRSWIKEVDPQHLLRMSASLGSSVNYLACSKSCDSQMRARIAEAIDQMTRDGTIRAIEVRYGVND